MNLDAAKVRELLPCFVCGDLPEHVAAQVQAILDANPQLQTEALHLRDAEGACQEFLAGLADQMPALGDLAAPAMPELVPTPALPPVLPLRAPLSLLAAAAGVLLVVGMSAWQGASRAPLQGLLAKHGPITAGTDSAFVAGQDPATLRRALIDAGALPGLAMVPDLSALGLQLVGAQVTTDRPGVVIVYQRDGIRYACQMYTGEAPADAPQAVRLVAGTLLRGFHEDGLSVVVWDAVGMVCLFSAPLPLDQLMAAVEQRMTAG